MFLSTQSVSRPKRDSIYSFMRHSGPLGCITTEIFSENHCCLKRRFSENLDSTASTGQLEQKITLFAIFQYDSCGQSYGKIVKNRSHIAKFGCGSGAILVILFKKIGYFFSKIRKKWKKWKKEAAKKNLGNIPNVKFFRADTYFGGTQNLGQPEKHFFDTFFQFRPWRGPKCDQNQLWHVNIAGNLH